MPVSLLIHFQSIQTETVDCDLTLSYCLSRVSIVHHCLFSYSSLICVLFVHSTFPLLIYNNMYIHVPHMKNPYIMQYRYSIQYMTRNKVCCKLKLFVSRFVGVSKAPPVQCMPYFTAKKSKFKAPGNILLERAIYCPGEQYIACMGAKY